MTIETDHSEFSTAFPHLAKHLAFTKGDGRNNSESISLLEIGKIILDIKKAFIETVKKSIPKDNTLPLIFLIGATGAGKSTTACFLRKEKLILKNYSYHQEKSATEQLIGHSQDTSHTFLPKVNSLENFLLVDFPGFGDSNGPIVGLGIELALKALITEHDSKVLLLHSITDTEARYDRIIQASSRLKRLFENSKDCLLGLTKYSKIAFFSPETIKSTEEIFLKNANLSQLIAFDDLENENKRDKYINALSSESINFIKINTKLSLDPQTNALLQKRFNDYLEAMYSEEANNQEIQYANLDELSEKILTSSFINAVDSKLGEFLHLPGMDPELIQLFNENLITLCFNRYVEMAVSLDLIAFKQCLNQLKKNFNTLFLEEEILGLESYLKALSGGYDDTKDDDKKWQIHTENAKDKYSDQKIDQYFKLPYWAQRLPFISNKTPHTLYSFSRDFSQNKENKEISDEILTACINEIEQIQNTLISLARIKNMVYKKEHIKISPPAKYLDLAPFEQKEYALLKVLNFDCFFKSQYELSNALKKMLKKARNLKQRGFQKEAETIQELVEKLISQAKNHMQDPIQKEQYQAFKEEASAAIQKAHNVLKQHRDCHIILANIGLGIAGLGIFYGIAVAINRVQKGDWFFFNKTKSVQKLDNLKMAIDDMCGPSKTP